MTHPDNLHLIDDLLPPVMHDAVRFRQRERNGDEMAVVCAFCGSAVSAVKLDDIYAAGYAAAREQAAALIESNWCFTGAAAASLMAREIRAMQPPERKDGE